MLLYTISTLYHSLRGRAKAVFCKLDHSAIYLLIAGTYTPFTLVTLRGAWGWSMFGVVWALAILGIAQELWLKQRSRVLSVILYLAMGWVAVAAVHPLLQALGWNGFVWLVVGGLLYTVGVVFYALEVEARTWCLALVRAGGKREPLQRHSALRGARFYEVGSKGQDGRQRKTEVQHARAAGRDRQGGKK